MRGDSRTAKSAITASGFAPLRDFGGEKAALIFPAEFLEAANPGFRASEKNPGDAVPDPADLANAVGQLIKLSLLERRPSIEWVCRRMRIS